MIEVVYYMDGKEVGRAIVNPYDKEMPYRSSDEYITVFDGEKRTRSDEVVCSIPKKSVMLFVKK